MAYSPQTSHFIQRGQKKICKAFIAKMEVLDVTYPVSNLSDCWEFGMIYLWFQNEFWINVVLQAQRFSSNVTLVFPFLHTPNIFWLYFAEIYKNKCTNIIKQEQIIQSGSKKRQSWYSWIYWNLALELVHWIFSLCFLCINFNHGTEVF